MTFQKPVHFFMEYDFINVFIHKGKCSKSAASHKPTSAFNKIRYRNIFLELD